MTSPTNDEMLNMTEMTPENQIPASDDMRANLDDALGLDVVEVRLPAKALRALEREAQTQGMPTQALLRNILQAYGMQSAERTHAHTVALEVVAERARQDAQLGGPEHDDQHGLEDFCGFINARTSDLAQGFESAGHARKKMIQIAALAVAAVESMDRKEAGRDFVARLRVAYERAPVDADALAANTAVKIPFVKDEWAPMPTPFFIKDQDKERS